MSFQTFRVEPFTSRQKPVPSEKMSEVEGEYRNLNTAIDIGTTLEKSRPEGRLKPRIARGREVG